MQFDPLRHVLDTLLVTPVGPDSFLGTSHAMAFNRVYGGQVLAQGLLACGRTVAADRFPHSLHGYFMRAGRVEMPILFEVERMRDGGSFSSRRVHAVQEGEPILALFTSFQLQQDGLEFSRPKPNVPGPDAATDSFEIAFAHNHPSTPMWRQTAAFEMRHLTGSPYITKAADQARSQAVWVRARGAIPAEGELLQRSLLAYVSDFVISEPLLRVHGLTPRTKGLRVASLDHAMWFHRPFDLNSWTLFVTEVRSTTGGRGLASGTVYTEDGQMVATFTQEAMLRVPNWP